MTRALAIGVGLWGALALADAPSAVAAATSGAVGDATSSVTAATAGAGPKKAATKTPAPTPTPTPTPAPTPTPEPVAPTPTTVIASPAAVRSPAEAPAPSAAEAPRNDVHGRVELSQTYSIDSDTARHLNYTDLRLTLDGNRLTDADLGFRVDGRGRWSWNDTTEARLWLTDLYLRQGAPEASWRFTLGRQTIRSVASAQVDGVSVEHALNSSVRLIGFAGLEPHPMTNLPNLDFTTAGAGYEYFTPTAQHFGGVVASLYRFGVDRIYLTQRSTVLFSPTVTLTAFGIVDLAQPRGLIPVSGTAGPDLTSALVLLRYRPVRLIDLALSASHSHTILPGRWWQDWMNEELRKRGFVIDGTDPVGTRVTSLRATLNLPVTRELVPFARVRFDVRHTEAATGEEVLGGVKWRPGKFFVIAQGGWRRYFAADVLTGSAEGGYEGELVGAQGGASVIRRTALDGSGARGVVEGHLMGWVDLSIATPALKDVLVSLQYQGMLDSGFLYNVGFLQVGYRF